MKKRSEFSMRAPTTIRALYNAKEWILCICTACGRLNHVEPHGITAACACSPGWTEHASIPSSCRLYSVLPMVEIPRSRAARLIMIGGGKEPGS